MGAVRRLGLPLIVGVAVVAVAVIAALSSGQIHSVPHGPASPGAQRPLPTPKAPTAPTMAPITAPAGLTGATRTLLLVLGIALGLLVLFVLFLIAQFIWRRRHLFHLPGRPEPDDWDEDAARAEQAAQTARTAVDEGIAELDVAGSDPRLVVIGCWVRLERAAAHAGTERAPSDTPADLVNRMLVGRRVSAATLSRLAELYRAARYGPHDIGERMRDDAIAALTALADELAHPPADETPSDSDGSDRTDTADSAAPAGEGSS